MTGVARDRGPALGAAGMIRDVGILPVIRAGSAALAVRVAHTLADAGLPIAEVTMTVPGAMEAIAELARSRGDGMLVGAGTVTDARTARSAIDAGARFLVTPCFVPDVIRVARDAGVVVVAGALTPTEVHAAWRDGADFVKVFPADAVGGAAYLRALRGPFPDIPLVPTGGVTLDTVGALLAAGAAAVGAGSELVSRDALARSDFTAIAERAARFLEAVARARSGGA